MSRTKLVKIYICDFCGEETEDKSHEKTCKKNPANKHCSTCDNLEYCPMDRDRDGEIIEEHYHCSEKRKTIRRQSDTVSNCDKHVYKSKKDKLKEKIQKLEKELSQAKQDYIREFGILK